MGENKILNASCIIQVLDARLVRRVSSSSPKKSFSCHEKTLENLPDLLPPLRLHEPFNLPCVTCHFNLRREILPDTVAKNNVCGLIFVRNLDVIGN